MVVLITGARAPVALDWARIAIKSGHQVWLADNLRWPLGRYLQGVQGYLRLPPPKGDLNAYARELERLLREHKVDLLIPTCEEIFYLAQARPHVQADAHWFMPETELLFRLHSKLDSLSIMHGLGEVQAPETHLRCSPDEIENNPDTILKPVYSRFGRQVIRNPHQAALTPSQISAARPWVQQRKIVGQAICNYALFDQGKLVAHQAYLPEYCFNQAAASYFEPYTDPRLEEFVRQFGQSTGYHGQAAFDFIEEAGQLFVLECNPRATSGLHLLRQTLRIDEKGQFAYTPGPAQPFRIGATLPLFFGAPSLLQGKFSRLLHDYRRAQDALSDEQTPLLQRAQWLALTEMFYRSARFRRPLTDASTFDIEWDGPEANVDADPAQDASC
ncbi:hypothetical protein [Hahella sp. HN01]|uniref:ATP-grasp domain-containing protein n=1 Tax=Hahella sp. HN01 TaxID=2847262 RepID=UPI001C1EBA92|nr:hypothetical protein [Hahella sp. HN01]MBU6952133.1 hypothetical protein [Hahella sp. HN01]